MNKIKELAKKNQTIKRLFYRYLNYKKLLPIFYYEFNLFRKNSMTNSLNKKKQIELDILIISHIIEKGLAHKKFRTQFAKERVNKLSQIIREYRSIPDADEFILKMGNDALMEYSHKNHQYGVDVSEFCYWTQEETKLLESSIGVNEINAGEYFSHRDSNFKEFAVNRHSVRLFDSKGIGIDIEQLNEAVQLALTAPSACNRQSTRVHVVTDRDLIREIAKIQSGSKGFGEFSDSIVIISSDLSLYADNDRRLPLIDSGIFTMNFVYSLYHYKMATCILNGSLAIDDEIKIKNMLNIKSNEVLATIIAVNRVKDDVVLCIGKAKRRNSADIITLHEGRN